MKKITLVVFSLMLLSAATAFADLLTVTGTLTVGAECPALQGDDGTFYTLSGDLKEFKTGDRVTVSGEKLDSSICMQGITLSVLTIKPVIREGDTDQNPPPAPPVEVVPSGNIETPAGTDVSVSQDKTPKPRKLHDESGTEVNPAPSGTDDGTPPAGKPNPDSSDQNWKSNF